MEKKRVKIFQHGEGNGSPSTVTLPGRENTICDSNLSNQFQYA